VVVSTNWPRATHGIDIVRSRTKKEIGISGVKLESICFANFDLPSASLSGLLTGAAGQINGTTALGHNITRVGVGTGVYLAGRAQANGIRTACYLLDSMAQQASVNC
jgi:hypothetical protein